MNLLRTLLTAVFAGGWAFTALAAEPPQLRFDVYLDGKPIGHHHYGFEPVDNGFRLISEASYDVKLLFVTVYRYRHRAEELWRNGCLVALDSTTDDDGEQISVTGRRSGEAFTLTVNGEPMSTGDQNCQRSYAYWHPELPDFEHLLNPQTGEVDSASFEQLGTQPLPWIDDMQATALSLEAGDARLQLWYGDSGEWRGLQTRVGDRVLEYRPVQTLSPQSLPFVEEHL